MSWSERVKQSWQTFTRCAGPLYGWTTIFAVGMFVLVFTLMFFSFFPLLETIANNPYYWSDSFSTDYTDIALTLDLIRSSFGATVLMYIVGIIGSSLFFAGMSNLVKKAYEGKAGFSDFKIQGFGKIVALQLLYFVFAIVVAVIVTLLVLIFFGSETSTANAFIRIVYLLISIVGLFLSPWLGTLMYYLALHNDIPFGQAFSMSWKLFRSNMGKFWGLIGFFFLIFIAIIILLIILPLLGVIASFVIAPFNIAATITWILSIEEENKPFIPVEIPADPI